jgi:hypothetical protein
MTVNRDEQRVARKLTALLEGDYGMRTGSCTLAR